MHHVKINDDHVNSYDEHLNVHVVYLKAYDYFNYSDWRAILGEPFGVLYVRLKAHVK